MYLTTSRSNIFHKPKKGSLIGTFIGFLCILCFVLSVGSLLLGFIKAEDWKRHQPWIALNGYIKVTALPKVAKWLANTDSMSEERLAEQLSDAPEGVQFSITSNSGGFYLDFMIAESDLYACSRLVSKWLYDLQKNSVYPLFIRVGGVMHRVTTEYGSEFQLTLGRFCVQADKGGDVMRLPFHLLLELPIGATNISNVQARAFDSL